MLFFALTVLDWKEGVGQCNFVDLGGKVEGKRETERDRECGRERRAEREAEGGRVAERERQREGERERERGAGGKKEIEDDAHRWKLICKQNIAHYNIQQRKDKTR